MPVIYLQLEYHRQIARNSPFFASSGMHKLCDCFRFFIYRFYVQENCFFLVPFLSHLCGIEHTCQRTMKNEQEKSQKLRKDHKCRIAICLLCLHSSRFVFMIIAAFVHLCWIKCLSLIKILLTLNGAHTHTLSQWCMGRH